MDPATHLLPEPRRASMGARHLSCAHLVRPGALQTAVSLVSCRELSLVPSVAVLLVSRVDTAHPSSHLPREHPVLGPRHLQPLARPVLPPGTGSAAGCLPLPCCWEGAEGSLLCAQVSGTRA